MHIPQTLRTTVLASTFALVASVLVTQVMIQGMGVQMASLHGGNSGAGYCGNYVVEAFLGEECDEGDQNGVPGMDCSDRCEMTEDFDDLDDLDIEGDTTEFDLTVGDLLYIPSKTDHRAMAQSRRISISIPLIERGSIKPLDRKYYDFT